MNRPISKLMVATLAAASLFASSPASAFWWQCIAKDRAGHSYEGRSFGLISPWIRSIATDRAMKECADAGGVSCTLDTCVDLDTLPPEDRPQ